MVKKKHYGDIRFISPKNSIQIVRQGHSGAVDKSFSWNVLLSDIFWRLHVQPQQQEIIAITFTLIPGRGWLN